MMHFLQLQISKEIFLHFLVQAAGHSSGVENINIFLLIELN